MDDALKDWCEAGARAHFGAGGATAWQALAVEASHRRFYRLHWRRGAASDSLVVMDSPPERENNDQFVALARLFGRHGIGVPALIAEDRERGWFLMSDLGSTHFADVYPQRGPAPVMPLALDALHHLQGIDDPLVPPYTRARFADELAIYLTWFVETLLEQRAAPALDDVFAELLAATDAQPRCCVHRDFHSRNLLVTDQGTLGVVDFQDALVGPATYDLASLLRDCYYRMAEPEVARWREVYLQGTALDVDRTRFAADLDLTALQRQLKAVGIFARLHLRDGRDSHLAHIVPVLRRVAELARRYPALAGLVEHVEGVLPMAAARLGDQP